MWKIVQHDQPDDYVVGTGTHYSVREFVEEAFHQKGVAIRWIGSGEDEIGQDISTGKIVVRVDPKYYRPTEVNLLCADASKAATLLRWKPSVSFKELVEDMLLHDEQEIQ